MSFLNLLVFACVPISLSAQPTLDEGYRQMYNLEFDQAHKTFADWMQLHPADPLGPASDAAGYLFSELDRLHILQGEFFLHDENFRTKQKLNVDPVLAKAFHDQLARATDLANKALATDPKNTNALFASSLALGLRSDFEGLIEKRYFSSLTTTKQNRLLAEKLLGIDPNFHDAWVAIGIENYLLSLKPMPVRWVLQLAGNKTDKAVGIEKLRITAEKGRYFRPFAELMLAVAAIRDGDKMTARNILEKLSKEFPKNHLYQQELSRLR